VNWKAKVAGKRAAATPQPEGQILIPGGGKKNIFPELRTRKKKTKWEGGRGKKRSLNQVQYLEAGQIGNQNHKKRPLVGVFVEAETMKKHGGGKEGLKKSRSFSDAAAQQKNPKT